MSENEISTTYKIIADSALETMARINAKFLETGKSVKFTKGRLTEFESEINSVVASLEDGSGAATTFANGFKEIVASSGTTNSAFNKLSEQISKIENRINKGTAAAAAFSNRMRAFRGEERAKEIAVSVRAQEALTASIEATNTQLLREDRLRILKGQKPLNPQAKFSDEEEKAAYLEGLQSREQASVEAWHTKQRALEAQTTKQLESELIQREEAKRRMMEQGLRETQTFDSFSSMDSELERRAKEYYDNALEKAKDHIDEKAALERKGESIISDIKKKQLEIDYIVAEFFRKKEEKDIKETTAKFKAEVEKRIQAAKAFEDAKRIGMSSSQFDNLKGSKLEQLQTGARIVNNKPADDIDAAAIKQMASSYRDTSSAQAEVIANAKRLGIPLRENLEKAKEFTLSWKTMGRILVAQTFSQVFFAIQNSLREAVTASEDLYKAVGEIQTITDRASQGALAYNTALQSVIDTSGRINFTPQDTANAYYETLSNQIGENVSQITSFIEEAGNLGKVTRATLADSTDAISSVINAYNMSVGEAGKVSSQLFTLVDQGRLKLEEVANSMGNVSVPAAQLGIDFDNVVAGLSAISIAGVPPRESMTLFRNVMFKLIDPTEAMTDLFARWGVSSGQAAVSTFGFAGVLAKLSVEARKGNHEFQDLFGSTRAYRGGLGLTEENFQKYAKALDASRKSQENYGKIVDEYLKNPGEQYRKLIQQTSNEFLQIGLSIVNTIAGVSKFTGSTKEGTFYLAQLLGILGKIVIVLGVTGTAFLIASTAAVATSAAFGATAGAAGVLTAALTALSMTPPMLIFTAIATAAAAATSAFLVLHKTTTQVNAEITAKAQEANKNVGKAYTEGILAAFKTLSDEYKSNLRKTLTDASDKVQELTADIEKIEGENAIEKVIERFKRLEDAISGSEAQQRLSFAFGDLNENLEIFKNSMGITTKELQRGETYWANQVDSIQAVIDKLKDQRRAVLDLVSTNRMNLKTSITERNISGLVGPAKAQAQYQAAQDAANQAMQVTDPEEAKKLFDIARKFLSDSEATAFENGTLGTLQNHINYFNDQEAALYAAQERRLSQENDAINLELTRQESLADEADIKREANAVELETREIAKDTYEIQRTFLEYYQKKLAEIAKDKTTSFEEEQKQILTLNRLMQEGLDKGYIPSTDKLIAALKAGQDTQPLRVKREQITSEADQALLTARDIDSEEAGRNKSLTDSTSNLEQASGSLEAAVEMFIRETQQAALGAYGPLGQSSSIQAELLLPSLKDILSRFEAAKALNESKDLSNPEFATVLEGLIKEFNSIVKDKGSKQVNETITTASRVLNTAAQELVNASNYQSNVEKLTIESNQRLKELTAIVGELKKSTDQKVLAEEKFISQLETQGSLTPLPEDVEAANKTTSEYKSKSDFYNERAKAQGNTGSSEGEFDTSRGDGTSVRPFVEDFTNALKKTKELDEKVLDFWYNIDKKAGFIPKDTSRDKYDKARLGPVLGADSFDEGMKTLFDGLAKDFGAVTVEVIIAKLMPKLANWRIGLAASPLGIVASTVANAQTAGGPDEMIPGNRDPNTKMAYDTSKAPSDLAEQEQRAQEAYLSKQAEITAAQQQAAQVQLEAAQTQVQASNSLYADTPQAPLKVTDEAQAQAEEMARQQAEAGAQTFVNFIDEAVRQAQAKTPMIGGLPADMYPGQNIAPNTINGQPIAADRKNFGMVDGQAYVDDPAKRDYAAGAWSTAVEQGAQAIPEAVAQGAQAIPQAMAQSYPALSQAVVDGMAYAFRQQQQAQSEGVHYAQPERRFAMGGPVGTDTIPAWLSPGEFVVRAPAVRKNFDILQAINSGVFQRYNNGGMVSNNQSFTNNFSLHSKNPNIQINQIVNAVRRQVAQGKATLTKGRPY